MAFWRHCGTLAQRTVYKERVGLTPKRVQRVLDQWDAITAPGQERWFNFQLLLCAAMTVACLIFGAWWIAALFAAITLVFFRLLWERPGSKVRLLSDALRNRQK